ncbi:MAG: glycosyltransferase family 4 protein [Pseudomonadota bacterium]
MNGLKVLIAVPEVPYPPQDGWNVRHFSLIRALSSISTCDVVALTTDNKLCNTTNEKSIAQSLNVRQFTVIPNLRKSKALCGALGFITRRLPGSFFYYSKKFTCLLRQMSSTERYDAFLILGGISMAQYAKYISEARIIWDMCDDPVLVYNRLSILAERPLKKLFFKWQAKTIEMRLKKACQMFDSILVIAEKDSHSLRRFFAKPIIEVPNLVDLDHFCPNKRKNNSSTRKLLFTGAMKTRPNKDAVNFLVYEVMPLVERDYRDVKLHLVGTGADSLNLGERSNIVLSGFVKDLSLYYCSCDVFVCPLRTGAGIKNKILEAMACGCAIVTTPIGVEGLSVSDGCELLIAKTAVDIASAIKLLFEDPDLRQRLSANARHHIKREFSFGKTKERLLSALTG